MKFKNIISCLLLMLPGFIFAEIHPSVAEAMDYQLPENPCNKPRGIDANTSASPPPQGTGCAGFFVGSSDSEVSDMDTYTRKRLENKERRWNKCLVDYKARLLDDMETLKRSAAYGITKEQADIILANMSMIQKIYMTSEGVLTE